ncbi:MAG TPA: hypothetical protein VGB46_03045 [Flavisolibacter sp.]
MPRIITTTFFCLLACLAMAQVNSDSLSSLSRRIDSSSRTYRSHNDSIARAIDSITKRALEQNDSVMRAASMEQMDRNFESFMAERQRQEEKQRRAAYIRIAIGLGFGALFVYSLIRRKKKKKEEEARGGGSVNREWSMVNGEWSLRGGKSSSEPRF